ncbi:MAG: AmmeMemoRadiSam system protein B [Syntrophaceae bacterium]|nr:AmmeMemoRadiSam system protein B [Syntrophaceae bacterium]
MVPIDAELAGAILGADPVMNADRKPHAAEHSVEIKLPFLQEALGRFLFVPIVMGTQDVRTCESVAEAVFRAAKERHPCRGSSDLFHFLHEQATRLDGIVVDLLRGNGIKQGRANSRKAPARPAEADPSWRPCSLPKRRVPAAHGCFSMPIPGDVTGIAPGGGISFGGVLPGSRRGKRAE